jgi:hypothetical protein
MPGTREEAKEFFKALFVTFLGLVIALAMDNWHQERRRNQAAGVALESVLKEVEWDRKALEKMATSRKATPQNLRFILSLLEGLQDARTRHQPWRPKKESGSLDGTHTTAGDLESSAWTMALGDLSVQRFPKAQAEGLAGFYQELGRFQAYLDQPVDYTVLIAIGGPDSFESLMARLERFSPAELEHMLWGFRQLQVRETLIQNWSEALVKEIDAKGGFRTAKGR